MGRPNCGYGSAFHRSFPYIYYYLYNLASLTSLLQVPKYFGLVQKFEGLTKQQEIGKEKIGENIKQWLNKHSEKINFKIGKELYDITR